MWYPGPEEPINMFLLHRSAQRKPNPETEFLAVPEAIWLTREVAITTAENSKGEISRGQEAWPADLTTQT